MKDQTLPRAICASILLLTFLLIFNFTASAVNPIRYYTGDNIANPVGKVKDEMGNFDLTPVGSFNLVTNGGIGKSIEFTAATDQVAASAGQIITGTFALEFLWKPGHYFHQSAFGGPYSSEFTCSFNLPTNNYQVPFFTFITNSGSPNDHDEFEATLDGIGRKSLGWYLDGNYHHIVFKYNSSTGLKQIFVDGECPAGFSTTVTAGNLNSFDPNQAFWFNSTVSYVKYYGSYDNIAIYNTLVPEQQIYQNYLDFKAGINYSFTSNAGTAPPSTVTSGLDPLDYIAGTTLNAGQTVTPCPGCLTARQQLESYQVPRYKISMVQMLKNFQWFNPEYLSGSGQDGQSAATVPNYVALQKELYKNWNYYLMANQNVQPNPDYGLTTSTFYAAGAKLCKDNPTWQTSAITFRIQQPNASSTGISYTGRSANLYFQNSGGGFINDFCAVDGSKLWRPTNPSTIYSSDGTDIKTGMTNLAAAISPNRIWITNENGEYINARSATNLDCDPQVAAAIATSGLSAQTWYGKKVYEVSSAGYKNTFMALPQLKKTWFTQYATDGKVDATGTPDYRVDYASMHLINTPIKGRRYSTPDIYPRVPQNWRNWIGADHGLQWYIECKNYELLNKDSFFSPFTTAGWDKVEENTMRPGQYLGLLKVLSAMGAEFFYSAYFTLSVPFNEPKNWAWQVAMAPYAQAITSRYWDCFTAGTTMAGDFPRTYGIDAYQPGFNFYTGDPRVFCVVRKHNAKEKYAITANLNPITNNIGQVEAEKAVTIYLGTDTLTFFARKQGSVYIYDKTTSPATFYQLDGWHESTHPSRWTKDFIMEAENWDNTDDVVRSRITSGNTGKDYTTYTTVATVSNKKYPLRYDFQPRGVVNQTYYLWIKAATLAPGTVRLNITLDGGPAQYIDITGTTQTWYHLTTANNPVSFSGTTPEKHSLRIYQQTTGMAIDKVNLTTNPATTFSN